MRIRMNRSDFDALADGELGAACFAPIVPLIRGRSPEAKREAYRGLTPGLQGLFMFHVYVDHAKHSAEQYYWWTAHYAAQPDAWAELSGGLQALGAAELAKALADAKQALAGRIGDAELGDLAKDEDLRGTVEQLYSEFLRLTPEAAERIGRAIRSRPGDFVEFLD